MSDFSDLGLCPRFIRIPPVPATRAPRISAREHRSASWLQRLRSAGSLVGELRRAAGITGVLAFGYQMTLGRVVGARRFYLIGGTADELERGAPGRVPAPAGIVIRPIGDPDWPAIQEFAPPFFRSRVVRARMAGRIGFAAWRGDAPVGFLWVASAQSIGAELHPLTIPDDLVYFHLLYITPAERGRGLAAALQCAAIAQVHAQGYRRGIAVIETSNGSAIRAALRTISVGMPGRLIGRMTMIQAPRRRYLKWTPPAECSELLRIGVQSNGTLA
ncbi:MAG TPA: GNAT family N-acetyltransferase [Gemmatimonadales bacterium]|nr:GNAT family N-acetyltransferase [Gemmatimonadales bacterium]